MTPRWLSSTPGRCAMGRLNAARGHADPAAPQNCEIMRVCCLQPPLVTVCRSSLETWSATSRGTVEPKDSSLSAAQASSRENLQRRCTDGGVFYFQSKSNLESPHLEKRPEFNALPSRLRVGVGVGGEGQAFVPSSSHPEWAKGQRETSPKGQTGAQHRL